MQYFFLDAFISYDFLMKCILSNKGRCSHCSNNAPTQRETFDLILMIHVMEGVKVRIRTRTVRGFDYSPAVELSEQKDKLVTENWRY